MVAVGREENVMIVEGGEELKKTCRRKDEVSENEKHKDDSEDEQKEQDDSMPKDGNNQGSPSNRKKAALITKNTTSKSVTDKGGSFCLPSTSNSNSNGTSGKEEIEKKRKYKAICIARADPSQAEMLAIVSDMVSTPDFDHATLNDILKELETHFNMDLSHRKDDTSSIIEEVINSITDSEEEEDEEEEEEEEEF